MEQSESSTQTLSYEKVTRFGTTRSILRNPHTPRRGARRRRARLGDGLLTCSEGHGLASGMQTDRRPRTGGHSPVQPWNDPPAALHPTLPGWTEAQAALQEGRGGAFGSKQARYSTKLDHPPHEPQSRAVRLACPCFDWESTYRAGQARRAAL